MAAGPAGWSLPAPWSLALAGGFCGWEAEGGSEGPLSLLGLSCRCHRSDRVHELVDQALGDVGLPDDAFLVILPDGAAQLVVVHGWAVLPNTPQTCHLCRVLDLEDAFLLVEPADEAAVVVGFQQQLFEELPEVDGLASAG